VRKPRLTRPLELSLTQSARLTEIPASVIVSGFRTTGIPGRIHAVIDLRSTGEWLGYATLPDDFDLHWIGRDHVVGSVVDEPGVERIQVHAITADRGTMP
jgi:hypothetical protein